MNRLDGKTAIVTGGANGIGQAICQIFAEEGAWVMVADIDEAAGEATAEGIRQKGGQALFCPTDVSSQEDTARAAQAAIRERGRIDVLCNNAAYLGDFHSITEAGDEEWEKSLQITLLGANRITRETLPFMMRQRQGSVINISSIQALVGCADSVAYATVKAALLGFTRCAAFDYGPYNIRVNAVCPGPIRTRISPPPEHPMVQYAMSQVILKRFGLPREVAYAVLFLASEESSFITGIELPVDGGWASR
ncbi:MAG: glucose 1-dehydrogenase [Armatimonadetes bacterium]|nr:glucose 1-dehydrogenase [Armatimonadota bacterium]